MRCAVWMMTSSMAAACGNAGLIASCVCVRVIDTVYIYIITSQVLKWIHSNSGGVRMFDYLTTLRAAKAGHLHVLKWMRENNYAQIDASTFMFAAQGGKLEVRKPKRLLLQNPFLVYVCACVRVCVWECLFIYAHLHRFVQLFKSISNRNLKITHH